MPSLTRRIAIGLLCAAGLFSASAWAEQPPAAKIASDDRTESARAREAAVITRKAAESYTMTMGASGEAALEFEQKSLLQWANPVSGSFHGSVFVWTSQGRPQVVASIYKWYSQTPHLGVELHSLALCPVRAVRNGQPEWVPNRAGVELKSIPGAPAPAGSPARPAERCASSIVAASSSS